MEMGALRRVQDRTRSLKSASARGRGRRNLPWKVKRKNSKPLLTRRTPVFASATSRPGLVNMAIAVAAKLFYATGQTGVSTIQQVHSGIADMAGGAAAVAFAVALLASGASSSSVGTYAGQAVMAGFVHLRIPPLLRRAITMIPAIGILAVGVSPTSALVLSQIVLSFGIPFVLVPLVLLTSRADLMGVHVNSVFTTRIAWAIAVLIMLLNLFLLYQQLVGP